MKKILIFFILLLIGNFAFSQKRRDPPPTKDRIAGTSDITKNDKWVANLLIKKKKFNVYCGYQPISSNLEQTANDTLQVYKVTLDKYKVSTLEITKYATQNGKIIAEGSYSMNNDTLTVKSRSFNYFGALEAIETYTSDKYGLKKIADKLVAIEISSLSDRYLMPAEVKVPMPAKKLSE